MTAPSTSSTASASTVAADPSADPSADRCVRYDAEAGALRIAGRCRPLGADATNERVLEEYVDLVAECRGRPLGRLSQVRDEDVDALALALDLDAEHLIAEIEAVLARSPAEARDLVDRLRARRLQIAGAVVAAGVVVGGLVAAGAPSGEAPTPTPTTVAVPVASEPSPIGGASTVVPAGEPVPGVDLIPAVTVVNDEVDDPAPPATVVVGDVTLLDQPSTTETTDGP